MRGTLLTPAGRGALAVVGVGGKAALELVTRLFTPRGGTPLAERPLPAIVFGTWREADGPGEDVVVVRRGPEDFEIHCHGGRAAAEALLSAIARLGGRIQPWAEWLVAGGRPESEIEAREALARAGGPKAARILSRQLAGRLEAEVARVESLVRRGRSAAAAALLERLARAARVGLRLTRPWRVVVAGPVNAGKSSLVNALAGHARAIVSPEAGTTRDVLETRIVLAGWEVDLVDTAGLRGADDHAVAAVEREGIARAAAACASADLVVRVWDATGPSLPPAAAPGELVVRSKADLAARPADPVGAGAATAVPTSAVTGQGIGELAARIVRRLVPEEADDPALLAGAVPFTPRQVRWIAAVRATLRSGDDGEVDGGGGGGHAPIAGA